MSRANQNLALLFMFLFKISPIFVSGMSIFLGYRLFILGVTGEASLSIETQTVSGQLINAAPGLFFAVGGMVGLIFSIWKGLNIDISPGKLLTLFPAGP